MVLGDDSYTRCMDVTEILVDAKPGFPPLRDEMQYLNT